MCPLTDTCRLCRPFGTPFTIDCQLILYEKHARTHNNAIRFHMLHTYIIAQMFRSFSPLDTVEWTIYWTTLIFTVACRLQYDILSPFRLHSIYFIVDYLIEIYNADSKLIYSIQHIFLLKPIENNRNVNYISTICDRDVIKALNRMNSKKICMEKINKRERERVVERGRERQEDRARE